MADNRYSFEDDAAPARYSFVDEPPAPTAASRVRAGAAGVNKGFFANLLGLPVDTAANVIDLAKAGAGTAYQALSGKVAPDALLPMDRSRAFGTSDWIARKINDVGMGGAINNPNPGDPVSRVLYSGGQVAGQSIVPNPRAAISLPQNLANMAKGAASGTIGGAVGEVAPEWAGVAAMLPQVGTAAGAAAFKRGVRGGESGRLAMAQRMQDLQNGGVDAPSAGLASGNRTLMGLENLLAQTPGSVGLFDAARAKNLAGMKAKVDQVRDSASAVYGPVEAGSAIQRDLQGPFKDRIGSTYEKLNDRFAGQVPPGQRFPIDGTLGALDAVTAVNPLAPRTTAGFVQPRISDLRADILSDTTVPVPGMYQNSTLNVGLPLGAIKDVRTDIGKEAASRAIFGTPEQADFKQLYGGLSEDMRSAARVADMSTGPQLNNIGPAETALGRANSFYSRAMTRADDLSSLANRSTPEGAYGAVASSLNAGPSVYQRLRGVISPDARQKVVATVVDELGAASAGQQGAAGDIWSPRTFLTNYNRMDAGSRTELFKRIPGGGKMADSLVDIAKTADMLGDSSKVWANPSGTAPALTARGTVYALTAGAFFQPVMAAGTAAGLGLANQVSQRLLLNPQFVTWLAKAPQVNPAQAQAYAQRLLGNAKLTNDKQYRQDVTDYLQSVEQGTQQQVGNQ